MVRVNGLSYSGQPLPQFSSAQKSPVAQPQFGMRGGSLMRTLVLLGMVMFLPGCGGCGSQSALEQDLEKAADSSNPQQASYKAVRQSMKRKAPPSQVDVEAYHQEKLQAVIDGDFTDKQRADLVLAYLNDVPVGPKSKDYTGTLEAASKIEDASLREKVERYVVLFQKFRALGQKPADSQELLDYTGLPLKIKNHASQ